MELFFCDRCNTSIPQRDVDDGIAILRAGRAYCASCKRIATGEEAPRDVVFCDLCNVSVSVADMREERAVFREGRLYCAKCKFLVTERTATASAPAATSVSTATAPPSMPSGAPQASPSTASSTPRRSNPWGTWFLLVLLGMAAGFVVFLFTPDIRRFLNGDTSETPVSSIEKTSSTAGASSRGKDATGSDSQDIDLDKYFKRVDRQFEDLRTEIAQQRATDRSELLNEIDDLRGESARVLQNERDRGEALGREIDALRASVAAVDRRKPEPPTEAASPSDPGSLVEPADDKTLAPAVPATPTGNDSALARELERLKSPDAGVRFSAVVDLGRLADPNSVPALGALAINDGDNYVRDFAVRVLGNLGVPTAIPYLVRALHDSDALVANSANDGLVRMTKRSFGFDRKATTEQRQEAIRKWEEWWEKNRETFK